MARASAFHRTMGSYSTDGFFGRLLPPTRVSISPSMGALETWMLLKLTEVERPCGQIAARAGVGAPPLARRVMKSVSLPPQAAGLLSQLKRHYDDILRPALYARRPTMLHRTSLAALVAGCATILGGCAFATQEPIHVKPDLVAAQNSVGGGKGVFIEVSDERPSKNLGTRGVRGVGSELTVTDDFTATVRGSLAEGLKDRGFAPSTSMPADARVLRVEIRDLTYKADMGFWAGTLNVDCAMKAICQIGQSRPFEKLFRGEHQESIQVVQGADANTKYVNDAVSKAVNELLADAELVHCLASPAVSNAQANVR